MEKDNKFREEKNKKTIWCCWVKLNYVIQVCSMHHDQFHVRFIPFHVKQQNTDNTLNSNANHV